ncbi:MAG TPA: tetratricopeptide repeat protein, partial [Anaerolineae bacterium]
MATIEQQIKNIDTAGSRASGIGLVLGIGAGLLFEQSVKPGGGPGLYLGVAVWYATFSIGKNLAGRERGRLRAAIGVLIGLAVFSVTLVFTNDLVALLAPPALAYLATEVLFNNAVYAIRPVERFEDQIVHLLSSTEAPKQPAKVRQKVEALQLKRLQFLKRQFEQQLAQAERAPATEAAGRAFNHLVQTLTAISNLPADLKPLLGRAYLGLARHQAAAGGDAARRHRQVSETIKRAQAYPLPPDSIQFIARHYAAANDHSPDAVKAYTAYLRARAGQPFDPQDPVTLAAQAACAIGRSASASWLKEVETRARAFFDADNRLGWAALRLGQSLLWQGNSRQALEPLNKAVELLPDNVEAIFAVGQAHWALNHSNLALDAFRRASTLDPRNVEIMFWLGYALVADGRAERLPAGRRKNTAAEARRHLEAVVSEQPERGEAYYALALAHMAGDDHAGARSQFESALSLDSTQADWHYHYARALVALADYPAAVDAARKAIGCESKHRPALLLLGNELFRVRQWAEAESSYRTLLGLDATDTEAHIGLGRALFEQGHYAEAVEHLQAPAAPTHDSLYALGRAYAMLDDFQQAQAAYQQALAKFGPDADLCYALGCAHARLGQFDAALTAFDQSLAQQQSGRAHVQRGHVYLSLGDRGAAQAEYQAALHVAPRLPDAHYALGLYHYRSGDLDSARAAFANALRCDPNHAPAYFGLGTILEARAEYAPACDEYQKASAAGGPVHQLKLRLGVVAVKQERFEEAIPLLAGAWQAGIQTDELMYNLGLAHAKQSHWAEALEAWLPLAQRAPDDERLCINIARCRYQLGHQHFAAGDYAAATQAWQACMDVYGGDATLKRALAEAYL